MMYPLSNPNIDCLLAVVLEDPMSSNMCFQVTEEPTGMIIKALHRIDHLYRLSYCICLSMSHLCVYSSQ